MGKSRWAAILLSAWIGLVSTADAAPCASFTDVDSADPFCGSVTWLKNREITTGCAASLFCPNSSVTRIAMAGFLSRLDRLLPPTVVDANGKLFGSLLLETTLEGTDNQWVVAIYRRNGRTYALRLQGNAGSFHPATGAVLFQNTNCTGTAYIWSKAYPLTPYAATALLVSNGDRLLYTATAPLSAAADVAFASRHWFGFCDNSSPGTAQGMVPGVLHGNLSAEFALPFRIE